jgi:hypothetical protein
MNQNEDKKEKNEMENANKCKYTFSAFNLLNILKTT